MGAEIRLPDVGAGEYLVDLLLRMKIATQGDYAMQPRSWAEVLAFSEATGTAQQSWERQVLFDMSWDYVQELSKASSPFMKSPMDRSENG